MTTTAAKREPLTARQAAIFAFICEYWLAHQCTPSVREIGEAFGIESPNGVVANLNAMAGKGWVSSRRDKKSRGIVIVGLGDAVRESAKEFFATLGVGV